MEKSIDDIEFRKLVLKMYDEGYSDKEIIKKFNIKKAEFENIIFTFKYLDVNENLKSGKFSKEEEDFIEKNIDKSISFFIVNLKRKYYSVWSKVKSIKNKNKTMEKKNSDKEKNARKRVSEEEIEFIKESVWNGDRFSDIAIALGRSEIAIRSICKKNKIKRRKEIIPDGYKRCFSCGETKEIKEFSKNSKAKDGLCSLCRECNSKRMKKYYRERRKNGK